MNNSIDRLKQVFSPYEPFWEEWLQYKFNKLSKLNIKIINELISQGFVINNNKQTFSYHRKFNIERATSKLKSTYTDYQEWLIIRFQFAILKSLINGNFYHFWNKPISGLNIDSELKIVLLRFGLNTLRAFFRSHTDKTLRNRVLFGYVLIYMVRYKKLNGQLNESTRVPMQNC